MPGGKSAWTTACQSSPGPPGRASPHECPTVRETRDQTHHPTRVGSILHGAWRPYAGPRQGQVPPLPVVALDWPPRGSPCQIEPTTPKVKPKAGHGAAATTPPSMVKIDPLQ